MESKKKEITVLVSEYIFKNVVTEGNCNRSLASVRLIVSQYFFLMEGAGVEEGIVGEENNVRNNGSLNVCASVIFWFGEGGVFHGREGQDQI